MHDHHSSQLRLRTPSRLWAIVAIVAILVQGMPAGALAQDVTVITAEMLRETGRNTLQSTGRLIMDSPSFDLDQDRDVLDLVAQLPDDPGELLANLDEAAVEAIATRAPQPAGSSRYLATATTGETIVVDITSTSERAQITSRVVLNGTVSLLSDVVTERAAPA